jgi:hypothetical protein
MSNEQEMREAFEKWWETQSYSVWMKNFDDIIDHGTWAEKFKEAFYETWKDLKIDAAITEHKENQG